VTKSERALVSKEKDGGRRRRRSSRRRRKGRRIKGETKRE